MMKDISEAAALSQIYTNHSVRATAITLWSDAQIPSRHIMNISGHRNEDSIKHYNTRPSANQLRLCSDVLSAACSGSSPSTSTSDPSLQAASLVPLQEYLKFSKTWSSSSLCYERYKNAIKNGGHRARFCATWMAIIVNI